MASQVRILAVISLDGKLLSRAKEMRQLLIVAQKKPGKTVWSDWAIFQKKKSQGVQYLERGEILQRVANGRETVSILGSAGLHAALFAREKVGEVQIFWRTMIDGARSSATLTEAFMPPTGLRLNYQLSHWQTCPTGLFCTYRLRRG